MKQWVRYFFCLVALQLVGCQSYEIVLDDLDQQDANRALVILQKFSIEAQKESVIKKKIHSYQIKVKKAEAKEALGILIGMMPSTNRASLAQVFPPGTSGIIPSKNEEIARLNMAHQGEIESLLKVVPGILDAKVVLSFEQPEYNRTAPKRTASVAIIYSSEEKAPPLLNREVKELMAASISGLEAEDVVVVQKKGQKVLSEVKKPLRPAPSWQLMLTVLALVIAAYASFRLLWHRQKDGYAKDLLNR